MQETTHSKGSDKVSSQLLKLAAHKSPSAVLKSRLILVTGQGNECLEINVIRITIQAEIWKVLPEQVHGHDEKFTAAYINAAV